MPRHHKVKVWNDLKRQMSSSCGYSCHCIDWPQAHLNKKIHHITPVKYWPLINSPNNRIVAWFPPWNVPKNDGTFATSSPWLPAAPRVQFRPPPAGVLEESEKSPRQINQQLRPRSIMEETEQGWLKKTQLIHFCHRLTAPILQDQDPRPRTGTF